MLIRHFFKIFLISSLLLLFAGSVYAQSGKTGGKKNGKISSSETLEWTSDENAFEYEVEIRNKETGAVEKFTTGENSLSVEKTPGAYEFRVTSIDYLGREGSVSEWQSFTVTKALTPLISSVSSDFEIPEADGAEMNIPVNIGNVSERSVVVLENAKTGETIKGELIIQKQGGKMVATGIRLTKPKDGNWKIKVTDASGKMTESSSILIHDPWPEIRKQQEKERLAEEKRLEEERKALEEEEKKRIAEEKRREQEAEWEEMQRIAEQRRKEEEQERQEREEQRREEKARRGKNFYVSIGPAVFMPVNDCSLFEYSDIKMPCGGQINASVMPLKFGNLNFGVDAGFTASFLKQSTDQLDLTMPFAIGELNFVMQVQAFKKMFFNIKGGGNIFAIASSIKYTADSAVETPEMKTYGYTGIQTGASVLFVPGKKQAFVMELGCNFYYEIIPDLTATLIKPYLCAGIRF